MFYQLSWDGPGGTQSCDSKTKIAPHPVLPKSMWTQAFQAHMNEGLRRLYAVIDDTGKYMGSLALVILGITDVATLEAIACQEGLALMQDLMIQNAIIASDSKPVINDIAKNNQGSYGAIISEIRQRASSIKCNFIFEGRASNGDADRLSKFSHSLDQGRHIWLVEPHDPFCISHHVEFDE